MTLTRLATIALLVLHLAGGVLAVLALTEAWRLRLLLDLIAGRVAGVSSGLLLATIASVVLLALAQIGAILRRAWRGQPEENVALRLRGALYAAVGCVSFTVLIAAGIDPATGPARLRFPIVGAVTATCVYGAYGLWSMSLPRLLRAFPVRLGRALDLACMNVCVVLILAELVLRGVVVVWPNPLLVTDAALPQVRRAAERLAPGALRLSFPANAGGHYDGEFRNRSERETRVVVSIGDSFSYGVVPHAFHFTTVAERELPGFEIYNMGYPAIGPSDYLYLLENEALPLGPDLVLVQIFIGNDVTARPDAPGPPAWYDADRYLLPTALWRLRRLLHADLPPQIAAARSAISTAAELVAHYPWLADPFAERASFTEPLFLQLESRIARAVCGPNDGYPVFFETLERIERAAGDVPIGFVLIPDEFQVEDALWEQIAAASGQPLERDKPQREIRGRLEGRGLAVLDLLPILRDVDPLQDGRRHVYHLRDTHFNARGNEVAGRAIAGFVRQLVDAPPAAALRTKPSYEMPPLPAEPQEITRSFGETLAEARGQDGKVLDVSRLAYAKSDVARALGEMLQVVGTPADREFLEAARLRLAFFQPDVGEEPLDLDAARADGTTWREVVEQELRVLAAR